MKQSDELRKLIGNASQKCLAHAIAELIIEDRMTLSALKTLNDAIGNAVRGTDIAAALLDAEKIADAAGVPYMTDREWTALGGVGR